MALKGRHWVAIWLVAFLAAAGAIIARQTAGYRMARALADNRVTRANLEGQRVELERRLRAAKSRDVLMPIARRLGLRQPSDSEIVLLPAPPDDRR
ncbi:MAG TPA: hypothetical protein VF978_05695 [Gemmatimonadales bacterium]